MNVALEVRNRINSFDSGILIKYSDLTDITENVLALSKALSRMVKENKLEKIEKGVFYKPKKSKFGRISPSINEVIKKEIEKNGEMVGFETKQNYWKS